MEKNSARKAINGLLKQDPNLQVSFNNDLRVATRIRGNVLKMPDKTAKTLEAQAANFIKNNKKILGNVSPLDLKVILLSNDPGGGHNIIFQQYHGSALVYGGSIRFHSNKYGYIDTINNHLFPDLKNTPKDPKVNLEKAIKKAQETIPGRQVLATRPELLVYRFESRPHLVWQIKLFSPAPQKLTNKNSMLANNPDLPKNWIVYIDATKNKALFYYNNAQTVGASVGTGKGYYSGPGNINTWHTGSTYLLRDTTNAGGSEIITNDDHGTSPSSDPDNKWINTSTTPRYKSQGAEVDAHRYAKKVYTYFKQIHNRNGFDSQGSAFSSTAHEGVNYNNAYWDDTADKVYLGDGTGVAPGFKYLCEDDILGHEFVHGYIQHTCGLEYLNESGALNESMADIFGSAYINGDWLVGEDCWLKNTAPALRNMVDPTCNNKWNGSTEATAITSVNKGWQPSHYSVRYTGTTDNGGVHINSGIINNLFYLLTMGGTHKVSGQIVTGIGQSACEQMLFRCMTNHLLGLPTANFLDFREAMLDACLDLFSEDLQKLTQVKNAFNAVGIGPDLYIRESQTDVGQEPYLGPLCASPDIINRNYLSPDPDTEFGDFSKSNLCQNIFYGQNNYMYVRLQNKGSCNSDAVIRVYLISMGTFGMPSQWKRLGETFEFSIPASGKRVAGPITFNITNYGLAPGHYCLIAIVSDPLDPAPDVSMINSSDEYVYYIKQVNNAAWRNIDIVPMPVTISTPITGRLEGEIAAVPGQKQIFSVRIATDDFAPKATLKFVGPSEPLNGAIAQNLKRIESNSQNIYEFVSPKTALDKQFLPGYGFDHLLVSKNFKITIEYTLLVGTPTNKTYKLSVTQYKDNVAMGTFGLELRPDNKDIARHVTHSKKDSNGDIVQLGNPNEPWWSPVTAAAAIADIENNRRIYWTSAINGNRKDIIVVHDKSVAGKKYLRTDPDDKKPNNLDELPDL